LSRHAVILAAGRGTRLAGTSKGLPKCLIEVGGQTILHRQIHALSKHGVNEITVVVGYEAQHISNACLSAKCVENPHFATTNTAKSLLLAVESISPMQDILWMNGDVLFDTAALGPILKETGSCVGVNHEKCGDEEIKYQTDGNGYITRISKEITPGEGEALGINRVNAADLPIFIDCLRECGDNDYFERGLELAIEKGVCIRPISLAQYRCIEIDFTDDLNQARKLFSATTACCSRMNL